MNGTIPQPAPAVLGHEGAGVIDAVGEGNWVHRSFDLSANVTFSTGNRPPGFALGFDPVSSV